MNDSVTILGRVAADPNRNTTSAGVPVVNFRVASTQRRFDNKSGQWVDAGTNWYNVSAFRQLAEHAKSSLRQGHPVIVTGKLKLREWESGERRGISADIDADSIGHDLRWGASAYVAASPRVVAGASAEVASNPAGHMAGSSQLHGGEVALDGRDTAENSESDEDWRLPA